MLQDTLSAFCRCSAISQIVMSEGLPALKSDYFTSEKDVAHVHCFFQGVLARDIRNKNITPSEQDDIFEYYIFHGLVPDKKYDLNQSTSHVPIGSFRVTELLYEIFYGYIPNDFYMNFFLHEGKLFTSCPSSFWNDIPYENFALTMSFLRPAMRNRLSSVQYPNSHFKVGDQIRFDEYHDNPNGEITLISSSMMFVSTTVQKKPYNICFYLGHTWDSEGEFKLSRAFTFDK